MRLNAKHFQCSVVRGRCNSGQRSNESLREEAGKVRLIGNSFLPSAPGTGIVERRRQFDDKVITTLYPKMLFRKRRLQLTRVDVDGKPFHKHHYLQTSSAFAGGLRSITEECTHGAEYYFEDGLRKVRPYYIVLDTLINGQGEKETSTLMNTIKTMFPFNNERWIRYKIEHGLVQVNAKNAAVDQMLRHGDFVSHVLHMHEHPVLDWPVRIVYEDDELLAVDKPPSFVIHPIASFRMNTLLFVLKAEHGQDDLRPVHRLDKLTSGICVLGKGPTAVSKLKRVFEQEGVEKEYLAMVDGEFPADKVTCDATLHSYIVNSLKAEKHYSSPKKSLTTFERLEFDGRSSLLRCILKTGRTHQIRLHLRHLGFHIINDDLYNPQDKVMLMESSDNEYDAALENIEARKRYSSTPSDAASTHDEWLKNCSDKLGKSRECLTCELGDEYFKRRFKFNSRMFQCLHAWKYRIGERTFQTALPPWVEDKSILDMIYKRRETEGSLTRQSRDD